MGGAKDPDQDQDHRSTWAKRLGTRHGKRGGEVDENATQRSSSTGMPKDHTWNSFFRYFQLVTYGDPEPLDYFFLLVGFAFALAAGVPHPVLGILSGQIMDNLNGAQ